MRFVRALALLGLVAALLAACSDDKSSSLPTPSRAFCQAAYDYDSNIHKLIKKPVQQTELVQKLAEHAPKDIAKDAATYLDAMQRAVDGDKSVVDNPRIKQAVENVERRAADGCELYNQNRDGSGGI